MTLASAIQLQRADCERVAPPAIAKALLEQACARNPNNAVAFKNLGNLHLDAYDFISADACFARALLLGGDAAKLAPIRARCLNIIGQPDEALAVLSTLHTPQVQRAVALRALGRNGEAETEAKAVLADDANDRYALIELARILRDGKRWVELQDVCEGLSVRGANNAQLFTEWGRALAMTGDTVRARVMLFDRSGLHLQQLATPEGFSDLNSFNAALAEELLSNRFTVAPYPPRIEANRGSVRLVALMAGKNPSLIRALLARIEEAVSAYLPQRRGSFDPWHEARPTAAYLHPWAVIQSGDDHQTWHNHRGGWLSGVYYVRVPPMVSEEGEGPGCIEFGPLPSVAQQHPDAYPTWRHAPREGTLILAPSHYIHRTIPTGADATRISFAFDVVVAR